METEHNTQKTILVVDDEIGILRFVSTLLINSNYHVLTANSGGEGLKLSQDHSGEIHLLLSDFQMPGITGVDLATKMTLTRPALKVLLMSGFSEGMLVLNEGWHFMAKPFVNSQLKALIVGLVSPERESAFASPDAG